MFTTLIFCKYDIDAEHYIEMARFDGNQTRLNAAKQGLDIQKVDNFTVDAKQALDITYRLRNRELVVSAGHLFNVGKLTRAAYCGEYDNKKIDRSGMRPAAGLSCSS